MASSAVICRPSSHAAVNPAPSNPIRSMRCRWASALWSCRIGIPAVWQSLSAAPSSRAARFTRNWGLLWLSPARRHNRPPKRHAFRIAGAGSGIVVALLGQACQPVESQGDTTWVSQLAFDRQTLFTDRHGLVELTRSLGHLAEESK